MRSLTRFALLLVFVFSATLAMAQVPTFTSRILLNPLGIRDDIVPTNLNNTGQVIGFIPVGAIRDGFRTGSNGNDMEILPYEDQDLLEYQFVEAFGINESGVVVGEAYHLDLNRRVAFVTSGNGVDPMELRTIGVPLSSIDPDLVHSTARGINATGQIAGASGNADRSFVRIWRSNGDINNPTYEDLGALNSSPDSFVHDINDAGEVVGASGGRAIRSSATGVAVTLTDLGVLAGDDESEGFAINSAGRVVGASSNSNAFTSRAFISSGSGTTVLLTDLGTLVGASGEYSEAYGVNDSDWVVGISEVSAGFFDTAGFLWIGGTMYDLNSLVTDLDPYLHITSAQAVNNSGQIVVELVDAEGFRFSALLTPNSVPEPTAASVAILFGTGLTVFIVRGKRARASDSK